MNSYYTEVNIEKCKERIDTLIMSQSFLPDGVVGEIDCSSNKFKIRKKRPNYHNSFARCFYGELIKKENGTTIQGEFRMYTSAKIILTILASFLGFYWVLSLFNCLSIIFLGKLSNYSHDFKGFIMVTIILLFGFVTVKSGREKYEENCVLEDIKTMLDVKELEK